MIAFCLLLYVITFLEFYLAPRRRREGYLNMLKGVAFCLVYILSIVCMIVYLMYKPRAVPIDYVLRVNCSSTNCTSA